MPMLITRRMRLPVWPVHVPLRTRSAKSAMRASTACTSGTTFVPSTTMLTPAGARSATCNTERPSVTLIGAPVKSASVRSHAARFGERQERSEGRRVDAMLRIIEEHARGFEREALGAPGFVGEELAERHVAEARGVTLDGLPLGELAERLGLGHDPSFQDRSAESSRFELE